MGKTGLRLPVALLVASVCLAGGTAAPVVGTSGASAGTATQNDEPGVSFCCYGGTPDDFWDPNTVRYGARVPANSTVHFVVEIENGTYLGNATMGPFEGAVVGDALELELDRELDGERTLRIVAYRDTNGNGTFDSGTDEPWRTDDGSVVQAGPGTIDYGQFTYGPPTPTITPSPTATGTPPDHTETGPGFGVGLALLALAGTLLFARR
jgi:PGF-CTERM protein